MTILQCIQTCTQKRYHYAGLQFGKQCFCGDSGYDKYGIATNCDMACAGNSQETCGGSIANQVYSLLEQCKFINAIRQYMPFCYFDK